MRGEGKREGETHLEGQQTAEIDDLAAPARDHVAPGGLAEEPAGFEVDVEDLLQMKPSVKSNGGTGKMRGEMRGEMRARH